MNRDKQMRALKAAGPFLLIELLVCIVIFVVVLLQNDVPIGVYGMYISVPILFMLTFKSLRKVQVLYPALGLFGISAGFFISCVIIDFYL